MNEEKEIVEGAKEEVDLHELYAKKAEEIKEKYHEAIVAISNKHGVDVGVAYDMLKATCRGGNYLDGVETEINRDELKADYLELLAISDEIAESGV